MSIDFDIMRPPGFYNMTLDGFTRAMRNVEKKGGWKPVLKCPICGCNNALNDILFTFESINTFRCNNCLALYNDKVPANPCSGWYDIKTEEGIAELPEEKTRKYRKERFGRERLNLLDSYAGPMLDDVSLLDFGCGTGFFLDVATDHVASCEGVEISDMERSIAKKSTGCQVHKTIPEKTYDVITIFDVLEHVENPLEILYELKEHLNPDGIILAYTPNWTSYDFQLFGVKSTSYIPADHLLFFSMATVRIIASQLKMPIDYFVTAGMDIYNQLAYERDIQGINIKNSFLLEHADDAQNFIDTNSLGSNLRFILRKPNE